MSCIQEPNNNNLSHSLDWGMSLVHELSSEKLLLIDLREVVVVANYIELIWHTYVQDVGFPWSLFFTSLCCMVLAIPYDGIEHGAYSLVHGAAYSLLLMGCGKVPLPMHGNCYE